MDAKKKMIFAVSLIFLWAGLAVWQWRLLGEPVRVPLTNVTGHPSVGRHAAMGKSSPQVNPDLLASTGFQRQATFTVPRNIFALPRPDGTFAPGDAFAPENQPSASVDSEQKDTVGLEQYRYLGFLRVDEGPRNNKDVAVLKRDDEVLVLRIGDRVDDHLILKAINSESVIIRNTGTDLDQTISLSEESAGESSEEPMGQE
jgi:hypothetical protein